MIDFSQVTSGLGHKSGYVLQENTFRGGGVDPLTLEKNR